MGALDRRPAPKSPGRPTNRTPQRLHMASPERLSLKEKIAYGLGDTASNFFYQFFNLFVVFYYTDIFGLSAMAVGTMTLSLRVFDAIVDPAIGIVADHTSTRWGKFRPFLLWGRCLTASSGMSCS